jgi:hypothetical protein
VIEGKKKWNPTVRANWIRASCSASTDNPPAAPG